MSWAGADLLTPAGGTACSFPFGCICMGPHPMCDAKKMANPRLEPRTSPKYRWQTARPSAVTATMRSSTVYSLTSDLRLSDPVDQDRSTGKARYYPNGIREGGGKKSHAPTSYLIGAAYAPQGDYFSGSAAGIGGSRCQFESYWCRSSSARRQKKSTTDMHPQLRQWRGALVQVGGPPFCPVWDGPARPARPTPPRPTPPTPAPRGGPAQRATWDHTSCDLATSPPLPSAPSCGLLAGWRGRDGLRTPGVESCCAAETDVPGNRAGRWLWGADALLPVPVKDVAGAATSRVLGPSGACPAFGSPGFWNAVCCRCWG